MKLYETVRNFQVDSQMDQYRGIKTLKLCKCTDLGRNYRQYKVCVAHFSVFQQCCKLSVRNYCITMQICQPWHIDYMLLYQFIRPKSKGLIVFGSQFSIEKLSQSDVKKCGVDLRGGMPKVLLLMPAEIGCSEERAPSTNHSPSLVSGQRKMPR